MNIAQIRQYVVRPALRHIGLHDPRAENLVLTTGAAESRYAYVVQVRGPALGPWQMEPATHDDIWANYLRYRPYLAALVGDLRSRKGTTDGAAELVWNWAYAAAMCRVHYRRVPDPLPDALDLAAQARYWKAHYNTVAGRGTVPGFVIKAQGVDLSRAFEAG